MRKYSLGVSKQRRPIDTYKRISKEKTDKACLFLGLVGSRHRFFVEPEEISEADILLIALFHTTNLLLPRCHQLSLGNK